MIPMKMAVPLGQRRNLEDCQDHRRDRVPDEPSALNIAVEAARDGEVGVGFAAVAVADEVRSLALRAAEAAKSTEALIEKTVSKVTEGRTIVMTASSAFKQVTDGSEKADGLVGDIAAASDEQAQGLVQVSRAMTQMDSVTQQNSATAELAAEASTALNREAERMISYIMELHTLVEGSGHTDRERRPVAARQIGHEPRVSDGLSLTS